MCYSEVNLEIIKRDGSWAIYSYLTFDKVPDVLEAFFSGSSKYAFAFRRKSGTLKGEEQVPYLNEIPFYGKQTRRILELVGIIDPLNIEEYEAFGGYNGLRSALSKTPEEVIDIVKKSMLRGRGGAGFPTGLKWSFVKNAAEDVKYVICNADEGDPGAFMNRLTAEGNPHSIIEGHAIAGYAVGATKGYIFVRAEKPLMAEMLSKAIEQARSKGYLGKNIFGTSFSYDIEVILSAGAFVCGEETALMAAIEGNRAMPRPRPPYPATKGLFGKPTLINNVETLAHVSYLFRNGLTNFVSVGSEKSKGTKVFCLAGNIQHPGAAEVPLGTPLRTLIFDIGGGVPKGRHFKAVQTGGPSGGCIPETYLDYALDYETLASIGSIMGSGGLVVLDNTSCIVDVARYFLTFTSAESCGQCVPCRIGLRKMLEIMDKIVQGDGTENDLFLLESWARKVADSSLCALGQTAPNPILTTLKYFRAEYEEHVRDKKCRANRCLKLILKAKLPKA
ncbi:MAG: NADH-quinone oxidoreductase subunit F [Candidatus Brockarchaeota archaeon]|nr:NADH-quinone oxidoreductase subunit F [Candidatus Brockarchaeota archaeon]MBO3768432.1 NADH-quinone oxidoreductase subunit F [Candidatus Brockarchaeota archaeon]MBO3801372.1 NADH-quinone oxidoreductase subunit F [Candidatus Brockarchaeota archaeon]